MEKDTKEVFRIISIKIGGNYERLIGEKMGYVTFGISVCLLCLSYKIFRKKPLSPILFFYILWSFIIFLSCLNLYDLHKPSNEAYFLLLLMLVFFFVGSLGAFVSIPSFKFKRIKRKEYDINFKLFKLLTLLMIAFVLYDCMILVKYFISGVPLWQLRNWTLESFGSDNPILSNRSFLEQGIRTLVVGPFSAIFTPVTAFYFLNPRKNKHRFLMLAISLFHLMLSCVAGGGGRLSILCYIGYFLLAYFTFSNRMLFEKFRKNKYKMYMVLGIVVGVIVVIVLSGMRNGMGGFIREAYIYFALPPTLLEVWLPELKTGAHTYGLLTFFGVHSYFFRVLKTIGLNSLVPTIYDTTYQSILNAEIFRNVGSGISNAFVTPIYYFYIDGGYIFVCVASFFFGWVVSRLSKKVTKKINIGSFTVYSLIMYGVFVSFMRVQTCIPSYWASFIMAYLVLNPGGKGNGEKRIDG